jgi:5-formyltetrahydrofolate cyclo-ligase
VAEKQSDTKEDIRAAVRHRRSTRSESTRQQLRLQLAEQLSNFVTQRGASSVTCYLPILGEPDTSGFLDWAPNHGVDVLLPISREDRGLDWTRLGHAGTTTGLHGIREPIGERLPSAVAAHADLLLIPACAVDEHGLRLGWGLGYYDRLLASLSPRPPVFAVLHDDELLPRIPAAAHDVPVDGVITPSQIRLFTNVRE